MAMPLTVFKPKFCEHCGTKLVRKRWSNGRLEATAQFQGRRHCGRACAGATRSEVHRREVEAQREREEAEAEEARKVVTFPLSEHLTVTEAYRLASEQCPGVCPIECGFIGYLADNECRAHGRLPTDGGDPCGCWGEVIEEHDAREAA